MGLGTEILFGLMLGLLVLGPKQLHTLLGRVTRAKAQFDEASRGAETRSLNRVGESWAPGWLAFVQSRNFSVEARMFRISVEKFSRQSQTLHLEGQLTGPWVEELSRSRDDALRESQQLT